MSIGKRLSYLFRSYALVRKHRPGSIRSLQEFERFIDYRFKNPDLLIKAFKHRSIIAETGEPRSEANERLEFLGDAVLDLVVSENLYRLYPNAQEGMLARLKSMVVSGRELSVQGVQIKLGEYLQLGEGEARNGGRQRSSILEDALEAVIGAIYLDGGLRSARKFIENFAAPNLDEHFIREREHNYKSLLLEYAQGNSLGAPKYRIVSEKGPDHAKTFYVEAFISNNKVGSGIGQSKKKAEQQAAKNAVEKLGLKIT